jgi:IS1 transposase
MLGDRADFAQLIKVYAAPREGEQRSSPADVVEAIPVVRSGNPDPAKICTSHVERQNLTMRMQMHRLTRLTNGFSKKIENHRAAVALHFVLQFLPASRLTSGHARNGGGCHRSRLERGGTARSLILSRIGSIPPPSFT